MVKGSSSTSNKYIVLILTLTQVAESTPQPMSTVVNGILWQATRLTGRERSEASRSVHSQSVSVHTAPLAPAATSHN